MGELDRRAALRRSQVSPEVGGQPSAARAARHWRALRRARISRLRLAIVAAVTGAADNVPMLAMTVTAIETHVLFSVGMRSRALTSEIAAWAVSTLLATSGFRQSRAESATTARPPRRPYAQ